jgi:hypothetical protein
MAISVFPVATSASASGLSKAVNLTTAQTYYTLVDATLTAGNYTITSPSTVPVVATFYDSSYNTLGTGTTSSGSTQVIISSDATRLGLIADAGSNVGVTIQLTGLILTPNFTSAGTETITSTQTYSGTSTSGYAFVLAVGGGGNGGGGGYYPGGGGGSGGLANGVAQLTGSTAVVIGAASGTTSIGSVSAGGGGSAAGGSINPGGGGSPNGSSGGSGGGLYGGGSNGSATSVVNKYIVNGTTGGGGGGRGRFNSNAAVATGAGSGIGTGGNGGVQGQTAQAGQGYGAGGGGGGRDGGGGAGAQGIIYIRRF